MTLNPNKDLKQYYSIAEVAREFGVNESLLRYWETEFSQLHPRKAGRGVRQYTKADIEVVRVIYGLVKTRGLRIAAAREIMRKNRQGASSTTEVVDRLKTLRARLAALRTALNAVKE